MATGSRVHRGTHERPAGTSASGTPRSPMMGRGPRTPPMLEVRQMFEPTRLAAACLEAAYARIVPTPWRRAGSGGVLRAASILSHERDQRVVLSAREAHHG